MFFYQSKSNMTEDQVKYYFNILFINLTVLSFHLLNQITIANKKHWSYAGSRLNFIMINMQIYAARSSKI